MSNGTLRLLHVGFHNFEMTESIIAALATTFNGASGWARYTPNCWMLWTNQTIEYWHDRIAQTPGLPQNYGALILTVVDGYGNRGGKTYDWMWKWLAEKK
jgi:hypothetical protein